ncbi:colanic acid/amylovoran biosynthesis glycosyltransferase [Rhizobium sp. BK049]|uniref:glycosyltransferase n=1 Tax=Rhizobium sp. BK049 TaxID=2587095 RepID=UPI001607450D|nr:glycosyltransferase [Rhizobium sp. BK049]MBB3351026.1 colanic acid/amylovoran biosynthesis glycosyltransferase [Rhizobium sp. BK049]
MNERGGKIVAFADSGDRKDVVYFSINFPELSQTFVFNEMRSLRDEGADIRVVALRREVQEASDLPEKYGFAGKVKYLSASNGSGGKWRRLRDLLRSMFRLPRSSLLNVARICIARLAGKRPSMPISLQVRLAAELQPKGTQPRIHCHFGTAGRIVADLKQAGLISAPITTVFHGFDITKYVGKEAKGVYRTLFDKADLLLPISDLWHRKLIELDAPAEKIRTQRLGIDCSAFVYQERTPQPGMPLRFILVGRMTEKKGHIYAIEAFAELVRRRPDLNVQFDVVGSGPLREDIDALAASLGLKEQIVIHGSLPHAEVRKLLGEAHVFVLPSVTAADGDMEGIPVAIMEAMAMGLPVISTLHSGIPELVAHDVSGLLVAERDTASLSAAMEQLAADPQKVSRMGQYGRQIVEERYNDKTQAAALMTMLSALPLKRKITIAG